MVAFSEAYLCPICGSTSGSIIHPYKGTSPGFVNKVIAACDFCHVLHIFPLPTEEEITSHYDAYWDPQFIDSMLPLYAKQAESRIAFLLPYLPDVDSLAVLDVGAGFGSTYKALAAVFPSREIHYDTVEVDPLAVEFLNKSIKPRAQYRSTTEIRERYHLVILSHIIEHVRDPLAFLRQHQRMLNDNGVLFVEVPNQDYLFKAQNEPHLFFFSPQELPSLMALAGYEVLDIRTCGQSIRRMQLGAGSQIPCRDFVRRIIPKRMLDLMRRGVKRSNAQATAESVAEYREDGRWIRIALRKRILPSLDA